MSPLAPDEARRLADLERQYNDLTLQELGLLDEMDALRNKRDGIACFVTIEGMPEVRLAGPFDSVELADEAAGAIEDVAGLIKTDIITVDTGEVFVPEDSETRA